MATEVDGILFAIREDKRATRDSLNAVDRVENRIRRFRKRLQDVDKQTDRLGRTTATVNKELAKIGRENQLRQMAQDAAKMAQKQGDAAEATRRLADQLTRARASQQEVQRTTTQFARIQAASGGGEGGRIARIGRGIINAPDVGPSTDIGRLLIVLGRMGATFQGLAIAAPAATIAITGIVLAVQHFGRVLEEAKQHLQAAIKAQEAYYNAQSTLNEEEANARIRDLENDRRRIEQQIAETEGALKGTRAATARGIQDITVGGVPLLPQGPQGTGLAIALEAIINPSADLTGNLDELQQQLDENIQTTDRLRIGLENEHFAETQRAQDIQRTSEIFLEAQRFARTATTEQVEQRLDDLERERRALEAVNMQEQELANSGNLAAQNIIAENEARIEEIAQIHSATEAISADVAAREAEEAAIKAQTEALLAMLAAMDRNIASQVQLGNLLEDATVEGVDKRQRAIQREIDAIEDQLPRLRELAETSDEAADKLADYEQKIADLNREASNLSVARPIAALREYQAAAEDVAKAQQAVTEAIEQHNTNVARIEATLTEARLKAEETRSLALANAREAFHEGEVKAEKDYQKAVRDARRRFEVSTQQAIRNRDVVAAIQAREQRDRELEEAKEQRNDQLENLRNNLRKQERAAQQAYERSIRQAHRAYQKQLQLENQRYRKEIQQRQQALQIELNQQNQFWNAMHQQSAQGYNGLLGLLNNFFNSAGARVSSGSARPTSAAGQAGASLGQAFFGLFNRASGGDIPAGQPTLVHANEVIRIPFRANVQRAGAGGSGGGVNIPVTVNGAGMNRRQIKDMVLVELDGALTEAGID